MNEKRIKELQDFANDFDRQLKNAEESYELNLKNMNLLNKNNKFKKSYSSLGSKSQNKTMISKYNMPFSTPTMPIVSQKEKRNTKSCKKKQGKISGNIYKNLLPWIPPHYVGNYFDNFKILKDRHNLSAWEKVITLIFFIFYFYRIELVYVKEAIQKK